MEVVFISEKVRRLLLQRAVLMPADIRYMAMAGASRLLFLVRLRLNWKLKLICLLLVFQGAERGP